MRLALATNRSDAESRATSASPRTPSFVGNNSRSTGPESVGHRPTRARTGHRAPGVEDHEKSRGLFEQNSAHEDACSLLRERKPLIYRLIQHHQRECPLSVVCRVLEVGVSGYFVWRGRPGSHHTQGNKTLTETIKTIYLKSRATSGSPRVQAERREQGQQVSRARETRRMKAAGLKMHCKRTFRTTTNLAHRHVVADTLLAREFTAAELNQNWATDITYLPTQEGWLSLAIIMDLCSLAGRCERPCTPTWCSRRWTSPSGIKSPLKTCCPLGSRDSICQWCLPGGADASRRGAEHEQESAMLGQSGTGELFSTLQLELNLEKAHGTRPQPRTLVVEWIEAFYNRERRHSGLGCPSPHAFEERWATLGQTELTFLKILAISLDPIRVQQLSTYKDVPVDLARVQAH